MTPDLDVLHQVLDDAVQKISQDSQGVLKTLLRDTLDKLVTPAERLWDIMFYPHQNAVIRAAIEMGIFHSLASKDNKGGLTIEELALKVPDSGADTILVARVMRMLAGMGIVKEVGMDRYENSSVGELLANDIYLEGGMKFM
jgi:hypothetical protein